MGKTITIEEKVSKLLSIKRNIEEIENKKYEKIEEARVKYLGKFNDFNEDEEFIDKSKYLLQKCGEDPLNKQSKKFKYPPEKPSFPIFMTLFGLAGLLGIILSIIGFVMCATKGADAPYFQVILAIVGIIGFIITKSGYKEKNKEYNENYIKYLNEKKVNEKLKKEHDLWKVKSLAAEKNYEKEKLIFIEKQKKLGKEYEEANEKYEEEEQKIQELYHTDEYDRLMEAQEKLSSDLIIRVKKEDDRIPASKKYGLDLFTGIPLSDDDDMFELIGKKYWEKFKLEGMLRVSFLDNLIPELSLYIKDNELLEALIRYYKEAHDEEVQQEQLRLEEERNELERERIRSYERQETENRRQQERFNNQQKELQQRLAKEAEKDRQKLAKQEADYAAARIRCAKCKYYSTCCSMSRNKKPYAPCFKPNN